MKKGQKAPIIVKIHPASAWRDSGLEGKKIRKITCRNPSEFDGYEEMNFYIYGKPWKHYCRAIMVK